MSLAELLLTLTAMSTVMGGLTFTSNSLRVASARQQTCDTLRTLRGALVAYERQHGQPPPGPAGLALATLLKDPATEPLVRGVAMPPDADGALCVRDGYGREIRYILPGATAGSHETAPTETATVTSAPSGGGADFFSAGPDGDFSEAGDNLYGADLETPTR